LAEKLLTEMKYRGIAEVEFMRDERDQVLKFIEINGRPFGWNRLATAAGVNIPYAMYRMMLDQPPDEIHAVDGVKWIRLITDMPTVAIEILNGRMNLSEYLTSLRGKKEFAVLSFRDPLPFLMESIMLPYLWWKKGF
jgi:D-aspartate ligase